MKHALYWFVFVSLTLMNPTAGSWSLAELSRTLSVSSMLPQTKLTQPGSVSVAPVVSARRTLTVTPSDNTSGEAPSVGRAIAGASGAVAASLHAASDRAIATTPGAIRRRVGMERRVEQRIGMSSEISGLRCVDSFSGASCAVALATWIQETHTCHHRITDRVTAES